jgi:hypothetical protein
LLEAYRGHFSLFSRLMCGPWSPSRPYVLFRAHPHLYTVVPSAEPEFVNVK